MADLNTLFNLGIKKRVSFVSNGKTLEFDAQQLLHDYTEGTFDQWLFPDIAYDTSTEIIHVVFRKGSGHNNDFNGYIAHYHLVWNGSSWTFTEQTPVRTAEPDTWIITNPSIAVFASGRIYATYSKVLAAAQGSREKWCRYKDHGEDWVAEFKMTEDYPIPGMIDGPGKAVQLPSGRVLIPNYAREDGSPSVREGPVYYSDSEGEEGTFELLSVAFPQTDNGEEPALIRRSDGLIIIAVRDDTLVDCRTKHSSDAGVTWSAYSTKFESKGKNPLAISPNGTIAAMGRASDANNNRSLIAWSTDGGATFTSDYIDDSTDHYLYGGVCWHSGLSKFVFVWATVPDDGEQGIFTDPGRMVLQTWNEVDV
jgi:hypothetical protein